MTTPEILRASAKAYTKQVGWKIFPVWGVVDGRCECGATHVSPKDMGKHPVGGAGHKDATTDQDIVDAHWAEGGSSRRNIGVPCASNGLVVIDVDPRNGGVESWERLVASLDETDRAIVKRTLSARTGRWGSERGVHHYFRAPEGSLFHGKIEGYPGIDIKHQGYVLAAPSMHGSGEAYEWEVRGGPLKTPPAVLPGGLAKVLIKGTARAAGGGALGAADTYGVLTWKGAKYDVDKIVRQGIPEGERINTLYPIMCALANQYPVATGHGAASFKATVRVLNGRGCRPPLPDDELEFQMKRAIDFVVKNPKERMVERELGTDILDWVSTQKPVEHLASVSLLPPSPSSSAPEAFGASKSEDEAEDLLKLAVSLEESSTEPSAGSGSSGGALPPDIDDVAVPEGRAWLPRSLTDMGNARRLADHYAGTVRYSEGLGWFVWDDDEKTWVPDVPGAVALHKASVLPGLVARELLVYEPSTEHGKAVAKWSTDSRSTARLRSSMDQWKVNPGVRTPVAEWDRNPELLGVRNGVVNLRTGELMKGEPGMRITKRTPAAYERGMRAVQWEQFLDFATGGDKELCAWLQLAAGYTLTGRNDLDVFFIVFGRPGSGKSTFLEALSHVLGEQYSIQLPVAALIDDGRGDAQDEYYRAQLPGRRMAVFSEWPAGKKTKEDSIKQLTGDLTMTGRHPGGQPFTFQSQTKLWLGTNVLPAINDSAMWRRIRAIPFPYVPEVPNPDLKVWLSDPEGGLPAVMAWCVEGAVKVLNAASRDPLGWCTAVRDASAEYQTQEDRMGQFLDEETVAGPGRTVSVSVLFETYREWADSRGEKGWTRIPFEKGLREKGLTIVGSGRHGVLEGVSLRPRTAGSADGSGGVGSLTAFVSEWQNGS